MRLATWEFRWHAIPGGFQSVLNGEVNPNGYSPALLNPTYGRVSYHAMSDPGGGSEWGNVSGWQKDSTDGSWIHVWDFQALPDSAFLFLKREVTDGVCDWDGAIHVKYFLSGQQLLTIDFPAVEVHADRNYVAQGGSVRFTATPVDFTPGGVGTWTWSWHSAGSYLPVSACAGQTICDYTPQQTGDMYVQAPHAPNWSVNGISDSVDVLKCPTGDTLLDNPIVRKALRRALDSSYADSATHKRRERIGLIYYDTTTNQNPSLRIQPYDVPAYTHSDPCRAEFGSLPAPQPPFVPIAYYHTHPFTEGTATVAGDIYPANCGAQLSGRRYRRGPSQPDWTSSRNVLGVPGYIIDKNRVQRFDGTHPFASNPALRRNLIQTWPWNTAACQW